MKALRLAMAFCIALMMAATGLGFSAPAFAQYYDDGYQQPSYDDGYVKPRYKPKRYKKYKPTCRYEYVRKAVYRDYKRYWVRVRVRRCN